MLTYCTNCGARIRIVEWEDLVLCEDCWKKESQPLVQKNKSKTNKNNKKDKRRYEDD